LNRLSCQVNILEPTGPDTLVFVNINDKKVTCRVRPNEAKSVGETIDLSIEMSKAIFFDPDSGQRIN